MPQCMRGCCVRCQVKKFIVKSEIFDIIKYSGNHERVIVQKIKKPSHIKSGIGEVFPISKAKQLAENLTKRFFIKEMYLFVKF